MPLGGLKNVNVNLNNDSNYNFVSFDVVSIFTIVPIDYTVNIILNRIYNKHLLNTT